MSTDFLHKWSWTLPLLPPPLLFSHSTVYFRLGALLTSVELPYCWRLQVLNVWSPGSQQQRHWELVSYANKLAALGRRPSNVCLIKLSESFWCTRTPNFQEPAFQTFWMRLGPHLLKAAGSSYAKGPRNWWTENHVFRLSQYVFSLYLLVRKTKITKY